MLDSVVNMHLGYPSDLIILAVYNQWNGTLEWNTGINNLMPKDFQINDLGKF